MAGFFEAASHFDTDEGGVGPNPLRKLIEGGADIDRADRDGMTLLHYACREGHLLCVQLLLEAGVALEKQDRDARTPLHLACYMAGREGMSRGREHIDISIYLQHHGASTAAQDAFGHTPLSYLPRGAKLVGLNTPAVLGTSAVWATTVVDDRSMVRHTPSPVASHSHTAAACTLPRMHPQPRATHTLRLGRCGRAASRRRRRSTTAPCRLPCSTWAFMGAQCSCEGRMGHFIMWCVRVIVLL